MSALYFTRSDGTRVDLMAGCCIDGHWGQYGTSRLLAIADDIAGTGLYWKAHAAMVADDDSPDPSDGIMTDELPGCEVVSWAADEAEQILNDGTTGGYWGWHDGEFFLTETETCCNCGETIESDCDGGWFTDPDWNEPCLEGCEHAPAVTA